MTKGRLEAFSDGVIAIIITITVLVIDLPEGNEWADLVRISPLIGSYLISFILVGTNWLNHHHLLHVASGVNGKVLWANLLYLFVLSFIPVSTGWVGRSAFAMVPVRVYVAANLLLSGSYLLLERVIVHSSGSDALRAAVSESKKEHWTIAVQCFALLVSFIPNLHYAACPLLVAAFAPWIIPDLRMKRVYEESQKEQQGETED
ncbi:MAG: DUF1211 domain-containing protein [Clostridia bacterium]|nr:DUF1211 domain-containing protein [Clostridia bacterium]